MSDQPSLFDLPAEAVVRPPAADPDADARAFAVDPRHNVVLEASAGTGKTSVLVARYVNLLKGGADPSNILAITFTRKAAAEMRERIIRELRSAADRSEFDRARWLELRDRLNEIAISTIDAFCLSLLREFPLEADVDPAFDLADETEVPRLMATALDRTLRILVGMARTDTDIALVLAQLGIARTREGLATLLDRRLVAEEALGRFLARGPRDLTAAGICRAAAASLHDTLLTVPGTLPRFLAEGPSGHPRYALFLREAGRLGSLGDAPEATIRAVLERIAAHFLTIEGKARKPGTAIAPYKAEHYPSKDAAKRHRDAVFQIAARVQDVMFAFSRDLNVVLARGIRRMFAVALAQYRQALEERSVLDFSDVLQRALELLRRMDEFSQSRFRLESRYHHVLVDEFQDTSRAQWELVSLLVQAWGEGLGLAANPSIFIVGDRKQSIYRFRDAEVAVMHEAAQYIDALRPQSRARRSIARSFRSVPELLRFVNDVFTEMSQPQGDPAAADPGSEDAGPRPPSSGDPGAFIYGERDRFPIEASPAENSGLRGPALGIAVGATVEECAAAVADEIARLLQDGTVRDKATGLARQARPGDIAILFRSRTSHREFERELAVRGIPTYVYKGLGFFDADEIKDLTALLRYLADPASALRAAALFRSRLLRLSDNGLAALAPDLATALLSGDEPAAIVDLDAEDREVLTHARRHIRQWLALVDRIPPAELLDQIAAESAYAFELGGLRRRQAWENVKKMRGLVRRIQNRGYATVQRIAEHLMSISAGDESNAVVEALDAVNLMTVHASKGLEFPVVFLVNLARGASGPPRPVRVITGDGSEDGSARLDSVTVGPFMSDTDEAERERERHETRRLVYVALTRARDRLYLSSSLKDGVLAPGRGSLAEVLPKSLEGFFSRAQATFTDVDTLSWTGISGHAYEWRLCRPAESPVVVTAVNSTSGAVDDFEPPVSSPSVARRLAAEVAAEAGDEWTSEGAGQSDRLIGILTHRLFESSAGPSEQDGLSEAQTLERAARLLRPDERAALDEPGTLVSTAVQAWSRARGRDDVRAALSGIRRVFEMPFSLAIADEGRPSVIRGTIDCLVWKSEDSLVVVEFKTGRGRSAHQRQLEWYLRAVRTLYPAAQVDGVLLYV